MTPLNRQFDCTLHWFDKLGYLVPGAVIEVPHLLLVFHRQTDRGALLFTLGNDKVVDALKVFPILQYSQNKTFNVKSPTSQKSKNSGKY